MPVLCRALLFTVVVSFSAAASAAPLTISTFDSNREGWSPTFGAAVGSGAVWQGGGGNPGGGLVSPDNGANTITWFFQAASGDGSPLLGNHLDAYGGSLEYDYEIQNFAGNYYSNAGDSDIVLAGAGLTLYYSGPFQPNANWTHFSVPLLASAGWQKLVFFPTVQPATEADLQAVLANLQVIEIRGNYTNATTISHMDNVGFYSAVPEASSILLTSLSLGCIGLATLRVRSRQST